MKCYGVIDTNVLVSALLSTHEDTATVQVINRLFSGEFTPLFSREILDEYNEVLRRKKFKFSEELINNFLTAVEKCGETVTPAKSDEILPDMKDLPFYEIVLDEQKRNAYLVTGNIKHFPKKPFIVTARQFLDILNNCN